MNLSFDSFYSELISDQRWKELLRMYREKTIEDAARKVYAEVVTLKTEGYKSMEDNRLHVYRICKKECPNGDKPIGKSWHEQEEEKKEASEAEVWKPADPAHVDKCVKEFFDMLKDAPMMMYKPPKKEIFYNGKQLEKLPPYPITSLEEAYVKDRHFEWVKNNFEAKTGYKLPSWICEEDWNVIYDDQHLTNKGK